MVEVVIMAVISWLPYSTYLYLDFHLLSRRWQLNKGGSKMFQPLFHAGMSVFDQFFCRIYMSTDWRRVRSQKLIHWSGKHTKKTQFSKNFLKRASLKSGIPEMCHLKSRIPEMCQPQIRNSWNVLPQIENSRNVAAQIRNSWNVLPDLSWHISGILNLW